MKIPTMNIFNISQQVPSLRGRVREGPYSRAICRRIHLPLVGEGVLLEVVGNLPTDRWAWGAN